MAQSTEKFTLESDDNRYQPNFFDLVPYELFFIFFKYLSHRELLVLICTCHWLKNFCYDNRPNVLWVGEARKPIQSISKFLVELPRQTYRLGLWKQPIIVSPEDPQSLIGGRSVHTMIITTLSMLPSNSPPIRVRSVVFDLPEILVSKKNPLPEASITLRSGILKGFQKLKSLTIINAYISKQLFDYLRDSNLKCLCLENCQLEPKLNLNFQGFVHLRMLYLGLGSDFGGTIDLPPNLNKLIVRCAESKLYTRKHVTLDATSCASLKYM